MKQILYICFLFGSLACSGQIPMSNKIIKERDSLTTVITQATSHLMGVNNQYNHMYDKDSPAAKTLLEAKLIYIGYVLDASNRLKTIYFNYKLKEEEEKINEGIESFLGKRRVTRDRLNKNFENRYL